VRVFGTPIAERAARRRVGFMPDGCPFPEELTPRAVLDLLGALHDVPWRTRRLEAEALLQRVGLGAEARLPLARFSLGMKRRFVLAQALLHRPDVLLLDEPTAGLDASGYLVLDRCLREARARGATLLIASHVVADLVSQCTRAVVLLGGRLVASGEARELLLAPEQLLALYERLAPPSADVPCSR
jgi:ABC-2 type transport system ATP-binding protein